MLMRFIKNSFLFLSLFSTLIIFLGCGNSRGVNSSSSDIVAFVNKEPVFASEVNKSIAIKARQDPFFKVTSETEKEQLDVIIDKKLIIQEAINRGLARDEKFVNAIKAFWEQTLVRDFIDYKKRQSAEYLYVTEEEINNYYDHLRQRVMFRVFKSRDKFALDKWLEKFEKTKVMDTLAWEFIGPVTYQEVMSDVLREAFDLAVGQVKIFEEDSLCYLVTVDSREDIQVQPLETLRKGIEQDILAMKERQMLDNWLKSQRKQASVKVLKR